MYISGILPGPSDFDPSSSTYTISPGTEGAYAGFFAKYDEYGNFTWAKKIDTDGTNVLFTHILLDESENPILYGNFNGTADFDPSSNQKKFTSKGSSDAYFAKYNSSGKLSWVKTIGSTGYELICGLTLEKDNSLIALLNYSNTIPVDVDPGNGVQMTTTNNEHTFVHFSSTGQYLSFAEFGAHWITPSGIVHDTLNGVYLISVITGNNVDMDPGVGTATFSTLGYEDIIVSKYSTASIIASTFDKKEEVPFKAYPIPASQSITVELPANLKFCQARILNLYGQVLWEGKLDEANTTIDISKFNNGLYSLEMSNDSYYSSGLIQKMQ